MKAPKTKLENYALYEAGFYGNHLKFWKGYDELLADLESGAWPAHLGYAFRLANTPGTRPPQYCTEMFGVVDAISLMRRWEALGIPKSDIRPNEVGPDRYIKAQGELQRSCTYMELRYTRAKTIMSSAWELDTRHASGMLAQVRVKSWMDDTSWDNLQRLLDEFEDNPVIEFSCYDRSVGVLQNNTIIWEVRNY